MLCTTATIALAMKFPIVGSEGTESCSCPSTEKYSVAAGTSFEWTIMIIMAPTCPKFHEHSDVPSLMSQIMAYPKLDVPMDKNLLTSFSNPQRATAFFYADRLPLLCPGPVGTSAGYADGLLDVLFDHTWGAVGRCLNTG